MCSRRAKTVSSVLLKLIKEVDSLLRTNKNFQLGVWTRGAVLKAQFAGNGKEAERQFLFSAKNQITLWGPNAEINDYSAREWADVVGEYYYGRWDLYIRMLFDALDRNTTLVHEDYHKKAVEFGLEWDSKPDLYEVTHFNPVETVVAQHRAIFEQSMSQFTVLSDTNVKTAPYHVSKSHDPEMLAVVCAADPDCVAFNSEGSLFKEKETPVHQVGVSLYYRTF